MWNAGSTRLPGLQVIVVGNEKGGSGKTTVAMHLAIALAKSGFPVAALDLDLRQKSFTHYLENRAAWVGQSENALAAPELIKFVPEADVDEMVQSAEFDSVLLELSARHRYLVIDTPGHDHRLARIAHEFADTIVTPLNDSFMDLDVIGSVETAAVSRETVGPYARLVARVRQARGADGVDWIVLRNRLSAVNTRNKRSVASALADLSSVLDFRVLEGLAERVVFREFYPKGLTALDVLDEAALGVRPTLSHASAQLEVHELIEAILNPQPGQAEQPDKTQAA